MIHLVNKSGSVQPFEELPLDKELFQDIWLERYEPSLGARAVDRRMILNTCVYGIKRIIGDDFVWIFRVPLGGPLGEVLLKFWK